MPSTLNKAAFLGLLSMLQLSEGSVSHNSKPGLQSEKRKRYFCAMPALPFQDRVRISSLSLSITKQDFFGVLLGAGRSLIGDDAVGLRSDVERRPDDAVVIGTLGEAVNLVTSEKDNV